MINFDESGHLTPFKEIELSLNEFHQYFVWNVEREALYNEFLKFYDIKILSIK
jgi:hypothetical protein